MYFGKNDREENDDDYEQGQRLLIGHSSEASRGRVHHHQQDCQCSPIHHTRKRSNHGKCSVLSLRGVAIALFLLASLYWLYKVYTNATGGNDWFGWDKEFSGREQGRYQVGQLKLISVLNRHGDRAPSDSLPLGDTIPQLPGTHFFWPNGMGNLTESGRFRQFRVGLELRRRYEQHLDYNASSYLALSSPMIRCQESLEHTLAGLFDIEWPLARGLALVEQYNAAAAAATTTTTTCQASSSSSSCNTSTLSNLPGGSGSPLERMQVKIDMSTMPMLEYKYLNNCKYRLENPTPIDANLLASPAIAQLKGIDQLKSVLASKYKQAMNFDSLGLWSTLACELRLRRTQQSMKYGQHIFDWVNQRVFEYDKSNITLFDLYEQVVVLGYRDRIAEGTASLVQIGPIVTSLITSQEVALGERGKSPLVETGRLGQLSTLSFDSRALYENKKVVLYSSHDTILQLFMHRLGLIRANATEFEQRFNKLHAASDTEQLLAGFKMSHFGMSLVLELYEAERSPPPPKTKTTKSENAKLAYLQAVLYNEADPKYQAVEYRPLDFGRVCQELFREQNGEAGGASLDAFYQRDKGFYLDPIKSCPFDLFKNVTASYHISTSELNKLCIS